jgi:LppP/LprE lipoprotein
MKILPTSTALGLGIALATLVAACGSSSPPSVTVTRSSSASATSRTTASTSAVASATSSRSSSTTTSAKPPTTTTTASSTTTPTASTTPTTATTTTTTTTRTETAPAFVGTNPTSPGAVSHDLAAALAVLAKAGYAPVRPSTYRAGDTLRVVIGTRTGSSVPAEQAFFFDQTIYLGTDARSPSAQISLLSQSDTEVTLGYAIYRTGASTPSTLRRVHFALDMGQLSAIDPLPSAAARR